jgi:thiol-disulfide isomerase/thioredoxin
MFTVTAVSAASELPSLRLVACLCASWCNTCEAYRPVFAALAAAHPETVFLWVDIEDHADALEEAPDGVPDIQSFPTLLLADGPVPLFLGTVLPHAAVLQRMLADDQSSSAGRLAPEARGLVQAVRKMLARGQVQAA